MIRTKDLWFNRYVESLSEIEDAHPGITPECSETLAAGMASRAVVDDMADTIDLYRAQQKER